MNNQLKKYDLIVAGGGLAGAMAAIAAAREGLYSREEVIRAIDEAFGEPITFRTSARHPSQILSVRERINRMIEERI